MENQIGVSVIIFTYNQVGYIEDAIKGTLQQKTSFEFEVLIHDDASTDGTADIIREYSNAYPHIIVPFFEKKNQFAYFNEYIREMLSKSRGKYIAVCDGDDYWIDELKLQKQYDFMENNMDFALCTHNSYRRIDELDTMSLFSDRATGEILQGDAIEKAGALFHSGSHFFRKSNWMEYHYNEGFSDMERILWCCSDGRVMYFDDVMSVYRVQAEGSWSREMSNRYALISDYVARLKCYDHFDRITGYKWNRNIAKIKSDINRQIYELLRVEYKDFRFLRKLAVIAELVGDLLW